MTSLKIDIIKGYNIPATMDLREWVNEIHYTPLTAKSGVHIIHSSDCYKVISLKPSHKWLINKIEINLNNPNYLFFWDIRDKDDNTLNTFIRKAKFQKYMYHLIFC